jgi:hypothetical protein
VARSGGDRLAHSPRRRRGAVAAHSPAALAPHSPGALFPAAGRCAPKTFAIPTPVRSFRVAARIPYPSGGIAAAIRMDIMATPAWRYEVEKTVDQRLERLGVHVEYIQSDVTEIKAQIKQVSQSLTSKVDSLIQAVSDLNVRRAFDRVWFMLMSAALLGIMAKAFKWI